LRYGTRKEAAVKAIGEGLSSWLAMRAASDAPPTASLTLVDLDPGPGYAAALAVAARRCRLRLWNC
jgi:hypothetical protein